jgi:nitroreductase
LKEKMTNLSFTEIVHTRRSVRVYHSTDYNPAAVTKSLELATLAPNSSNMQLWEFYRISSAEMKSHVAEACLSQNAAKTAQEFVVIVVRPDLWKSRAQANAQHLQKDEKSNKKNFTGLSRVQYYQKLMPLLYNNDWLGIRGLLKKIYVTLKGISKPIVREVTGADIRVVVHKSAALAAQTFMLSMVAEGHDTCPMEGFDSKRMKKILNLPSKAEVNMIISCGKRLPEGIYGDRFRIPMEEVVFQR